MPPHRPTILQIIPRLDTGGAERTTIEMAEAVVAAGGRALVVTAGGRMLGELDDVGGEVVRLAVDTKNPVVMLGNALKLRGLIVRESVDLVHARSRAPAWSALLAARLARRPFVTTYHGAYTESGALKRIYNSVMARGDVVIANSLYTAGLIRARYGTPEARIRVIHRGIDEERFDPERVARERVEELRARWGVGPHQRVVLNAARLTGWKGQSTLIAAAARLRQECADDDWVVVLAGDPQGRTGYVEALERQISAAGLGGRVRLVGHVDDMPAAFLAAHVAVVASTEPEAFGRAAAEAEAMQCPVIATSIGAAPETVRAEPAARAAEITGWLVPPGDAGTLALRLESALRLTSAERASIGARARCHVMRAFTLGALQDATLGVYDNLLGTGLAKARRATLSLRRCDAGA